MSNNQNESSLIDPVYLPFIADELRPHFMVDVDGQIEYFQKSAQRYREFRESRPDRRGISISAARFPCQIEKDERFWTATSLKRLIDSENGVQALERLLVRTFGDRPLFRELSDWRSCLDGRLKLVLEAVVPSPPSYVRWLRENFATRHLIPYVVHAAQRARARALEGPTHVDAVIVNVDKGFSLFIEAKVLSDISYMVSFDVFRNQIARNLDVMLEPSDKLDSPLCKRRPEHSLFVLMTPRCFQEQPHSRLYGRVVKEYRSMPDAIARDLPHRTDTDMQDLTRRIGWITFEDIAELLPDACPWLPKRTEGV